MSLTNQNSVDYLRSVLDSVYANEDAPKSDFTLFFYDLSESLADNGIVPNMHSGKPTSFFDAAPSRVAEFYLGQILNEIESESWHNLSSIIGRARKYLVSQSSKEVY